MKVTVIKGPRTDENIQECYKLLAGHLVKEIRQEQEAIYKKQKDESENISAENKG